MTTQRTVGSKASASRRDKAAIEQWARRQLAIAQRATARAVREHFAAGRAVVFEKGGRLYVKTSARVKARPLTKADEASARQYSGLAEAGAAKYIARPTKKTRRTKPR